MPKPSAPAGAVRRVAAGLAVLAGGGVVALVPAASARAAARVGWFEPSSSPARLVDTRRPGLGPLVANRPYVVPDPQQATDASALSLNLTVISLGLPGFATLHPCGQAPGQTSTVNFGAGRTVANAVPLVPFTAGAGTLCVTSSVAAHVVVDLTGVYRTGGTGAPVAVTPARLLDTRGAGSEPRVPAFTSTRVTVPGGHAYVGVTLVAISPSSAGWAAVVPCTATPGETSTVNFVAGETAANLAFIDARAGVCVVASTAAHFVVDLVAIPDSAATLSAIEPRRVLDTRDQVAWVGAGGVARLHLGSTRTALLNVTAVEPFGPGFTNVWPCAQPEPGTSALSWSSIGTVASAVVARADDNGDVCVRPSVGTHLVADLLGYDAAPPQPLPQDVTGRSNEWVIGASTQGRPITARAYGSPGGIAVLGVGVIHGDETGGLGIVADLKTASVPDGRTIWLIDSVNPDGQALDVRQNARGVDLNRNYPTNWRAIERTNNYSGPYPSSEPETQAVLRFVARVRPYASVWWHQVGDYVDDSRDDVGRPDLEDIYVSTAKIGFDSAPCLGFCGGTVTQHLNAVLPGTTHFVVELPSPLSAAGARAHAEAFLALARAV